MVVTRRSNNATKKNVAVSTPKQEERSVSVKRIKLQRKALKGLRQQQQEPGQQEEDVQRGALEEQQQEPEQQQEDAQREALEEQQQENEEERDQHQEEDHLATQPPPGHEKEAQVENMGGEEVTPLDISSDEEETKPQLDHLSMLMSVSKPPAHIVTSEKNLKILMAAAVVLKDELVSHIVKTAHNLDTADMVRSANKCFIGLKSLKVDYGAFHDEVRKLIKHFQELKEVNEKNTCPDLGLKVAYEKSMSDVIAAREELANAERNLISAQTDYKLTMQRIEKLIAMTHRLKEEADKERNGIEILATKRDHYNEVLSLAEKSKDRYEKIQRSLNRLQDLV